MDDGDMLPVRYIRPRLVDVTKEVIDLTEEDGNDSGDMRTVFIREDDGFRPNQTKSIFASPAAMCRAHAMKQSVYTTQPRHLQLVPPLSAYRTLNKHQTGHHVADLVPTVIDLTEDDNDDRTPSTSLTKARKRYHAHGLENKNPAEANLAPMKRARVTGRVQVSEREQDIQTPDIARSAGPHIEVQGRQHGDDGNGERNARILNAMEGVTTTTLRRTPAGKRLSGNEKSSCRAPLLSDHVPGSTKQTPSRVSARTRGADDAYALAEDSLARICECGDTLRGVGF